MRNTVKWVALLAISVALAGATSAEQRGQGKGQGKGFGGGFGAGNMLNLLANPGVQTELKMTDDQKSKAQEFVQETMPNLPGGFGGGAGGKGGGGKGGGKGGGGKGGGFGGIDPAVQAERTKAANTAAEKFAKDNLKPDQTKRLKGIYYQNNALTVLSSDETLQKELNLTADQKTKFKTLNDDFTKDNTELLGQLRGGGGDAQQIGEKMTALRKDYTDKAVAALTDAQKTTWKNLVGEPYTVQGGFGRRGGGGGD